MDADIKTQPPLCLLKVLSILSVCVHVPHAHTRLHTEDVKIVGESDGKEINSLTGE